jgi:hypothetical protein
MFGHHWGGRLAVMAAVAECARSPISLHCRIRDALEPESRAKRLILAGEAY